MLHIGGLQKTSMIDFPGRICCVLFLTGCNFRCPYCHNPRLVQLPDGDSPRDSLPDFYNFLKLRQGFLDGVVITGGEPALQSGLIDLCKTIKKLGLAVKLDTNGSCPGVLESLLAANLLNYVAMDIKADPGDYAPLFTDQPYTGAILESIGLLRESKIQYEFRTTCLKPIISPTVIDAIGHVIKGAPLYALQICNTEDVLKPAYFRKHPDQYDRQQIEELKAVAEKLVKRVVVR